MSTTDVALAALEFVLAAASLAVAVWLVVQIRRRPGAVQLFRRPVPRPHLLAAAYFSFTVGLGANGVHDVVGYNPALNLLSLAGMGAALVFIIIGAVRRPAH
jgi:hypothetical protein